MVFLHVCQASHVNIFQNGLNYFAFSYNSVWYRVQQTELFPCRINLFIPTLSITLFHLHFPLRVEANIASCRDSYPKMRHYELRQIIPDYFLLDSISVFLKNPFWFSWVSYFLCSLSWVINSTERAFAFEEALFGTLLMLFGQPTQTVSAYLGIRSLITAALACFSVGWYWPYMSVLVKHPFFICSGIAIKSWWPPEQETWRIINWKLQIKIPTVTSV